MKICFVITRFPRASFFEGEHNPLEYQIAGGEKYAYFLARELDRLGEDVSIVTSSITEKKTFEYLGNIRVFRYKPLFSFRMTCVTPSMLFHLLKFSRDRYDLVHAHFTEPPTADLAAISCRIKGAPLILTYHGTVSESYGSITRRILATLYNRTLFNPTLKVASRIIVSSQSLVKENKTLSELSEKLVVIPPGIDLQKFSVNLNKQECRRELNIDQKCHMVLFVGTLSEYKGIEYLLKSVKLILRSYKDLVLIVVGEGMHKNELMSETKKLRLAENVEFRGFISENQLPKYYRAADIFVLPSVGAPESFGMVLLEAMATGIPVIATNIPGVRDLIQNGENGILVEPKDAYGLARAILTIIDDEGLSKKIGITGRRTVEEKYSWKTNARKNVEVYRSILLSSG